MARNATSPAVRLKSLEAARERAKQLKRGTTLHAKPMANLLRVSWKNLATWCDEIELLAQSDAFTRGGEGIEWVFKPIKTIDLLIKHFRSQVDRQAKKSREVTKAVGITLSDDDEAPTFQETKDLVKLTLDVSAARERMGQFTPAAETARFIEGYNKSVIDGILGVKTKVDPNGNLPASVRSEVDEYLRGVAATAHAKAEKYIEELRAGIHQTGTARSG